MLLIRLNRIHILLLFIALIIPVLSFSQCDHTLRLTDTYGDHWEGGEITVSINGTAVLSLTDITMPTSTPIDHIFTASPGDVINITRVVDGLNPQEMRVQVLDDGGNTVITTQEPPVSPGVDGIAACPGPFVASIFPANISPNLKLWLKAGIGTSTIIDDETILNWQDQSIGSTFNSGGVPTYQSDALNLFNYHPVIDINDGTEDYFVGSSVLGTSVVSEAVVYVVQRTKSEGSAINSSLPTGGGALFNETMLSPDGSGGRFQAHYPYDAAGHSHWYNTYENGDNWCQGTHVPARTVELTTFNISLSMNERSMSVDGGLMSNAGNQNYLELTANNNPFYVGCGSEHQATTPNFYSDVQIAEMIVYNGGANLGNDKRKIESYLAVKHGITLDNTLGGLNGDYISTNNSTVWDATYNANYHNSIIGIANDVDEGLEQKQSHTVDDTTRIYLNTLQILNSSNAGSFIEDDSYVMMGDNRGEMCATTTSNLEMPVSCNLYSRIEREWKITKTNFTQEYNSDFTLGTCGIPTSVDVSHLRLLIDDDGDFSNGGTQCYYNGDGTGVVISYNSPVITISNISSTHIPNNTTKYLTIGSTNQITPLPIELTSFVATCADNKTELHWQTVSELNNDYFTIERSRNGVGFNEIANIQGQGTSQLEQNYNWTDEHPILGLSYYRLTQTDFDGVSKQFEIRSVSCDQTQDIVIYPNPINNQISVITQYNGEISIRDIQGKIVLQQTISEGINIIPSRSFAKGIYFAEIILRNNKKEIIKLVKQ